MPRRRAPPEPPDLTPAERAVVTLVAHGQTNVRIAHQLGISGGQLQAALRRIGRRWHIDVDRAGIVGMAYRTGAIYVPVPHSAYESLASAWDVWIPERPPALSGWPEEAEDPPPGEEEEWAIPPEPLEEDEWTQRLRESGFVMARIPERRGDRRLAAYQRRGEDSPRR